jgi:hypothetical protein
VKILGFLFEHCMKRRRQIMGGLIGGTPAPAPILAPAPVVDTQAAMEAQQRLDTMERNRRGRSGTIQTSERGLVQLNASAPKKKNLLGE